MVKIQKEYSIDFYIRRFDPEQDNVPREQKFTLQVYRGMTVLDGLHRIKESVDPSLCFRFSCRMGVCGSCAMLINGSPTLSCNTQILDVSDKAITVAPLPNFSIIKDLVPDLLPMFAAHAGVIPYIKRKDLKEMETPTREYFQTPQELEQFLQFTYCIKCGACMAACPTMATDRQYPGPMPITQAYRYTVDTRDDGGRERKNIIATNHGIYGCHYAGECSNVCPKGVDPARAIQLMKKDLVRDYLKLSENKICAHVNKTKADPKQKVDPPPFTVM